MTTINKFNLSKIYAIKSPHTDLYYIGSTTLPLCERFSRHKSEYKRYLKGIYHFVTSFKIIEHGDTYVELLEEVNCENRKQLEKREGEIIKEHKEQCVNKSIAGRTRKEYKTDNSDKIKQDNKAYNLINADKIKQYKKEYSLLNADKIKRYRQENKKILNDVIKCPFPI